MGAKSYGSNFDGKGKGRPCRDLRLALFVCGSVLILLRKYIILFGNQIFMKQCFDDLHNAGLNYP